MHAQNIIDNGNKDQIDVIKSETKNYFGSVPHLVDDFPLSVYAYRLYGHIVRRAGDHRGVCFESVRNMADHCRISIGSVSKAKKELAASGFIKIKSVQGQNNDFPHDEITLIDLMPLNVEFYGNKSAEEREEIIKEWRRGIKKI